MGEELFVGLVAGAAEVGGQGGLEGAQVKGGDVGWRGLTGPGIVKVILHPPGNFCLWVD